MILRDYQATFKNDIYTSWHAGYRNVVGVMPTGGGKTPVIGSIIDDFGGYSLITVHRKELVSNISLKLCQFGIRHNIIAPSDTVQWIRNQQIKKYQECFLQRSSKCIVSGVNTIYSRRNELKDVLAHTDLWITDEGHHVLHNNIWGKALSLVPNAYGLGLTATPTRTDGKGLGREAYGVYDKIVEGPPMRWLIDNKYLSDYRIFCVPSDMHMESSDISPGSGEFSQKKMMLKARNSHIVGDVVTQYLKVAAGKLGMVFATDIKTAQTITNNFLRHNVRAVLVTGLTDTDIRQKVMSRATSGELDIIVSVDLYGEGVDVPILEYVAFARPTMSLGLYRQQFGRVLRYVEGKVALVSDHVGNVAGPYGHGLPDAKRNWTLGNRKKRKDKKKKSELRVCDNPTCAAPYKKILKICPFCGTPYIPLARSSPEFVEGDLTELSPEVLKQMRAEIAKVEKSPLTLAAQLRQNYIPAGKAAGIVKNHTKRLEAQSILRESIRMWIGHVYDILGDIPHDELYRRFYSEFNVDMATAQALKTKEALDLQRLINSEVHRMAVTREI